MAGGIYSSYIIKGRELHTAYGDVFLVKLRLLLDPPQLPLWPVEPDGVLGPQELILAQSLIITQRSEY